MATTSSLVRTLSHCFDREEVTQEKFEIYVRYLRDVPVETLERAVDSLVCTKLDNRLPTVGQIREACAELILELPTETAAIRQVDRRNEWVRERDGDGPVLHPLVKEALNQVGGASAFRQSDSPSIVRAQLGRVYRDLRAAAVRELQASPSLDPGPVLRQLAA